jgi:hypothetical protein
LLPNALFPQLSDHTGEAWVTAFQEQGVEIMGRSGAHLGLLHC